MGLAFGVPVVLAVFEPESGRERRLPGVGGRAIRHEQALDRRFVLQSAQSDIEVNRVSMLPVRLLLSDPLHCVHAILKCRSGIQLQHAAGFVVDQHVTCREEADLPGRDHFFGDVGPRPETADSTFEEIEVVGALAHTTWVPAQLVELCAVERTVDRGEADFHIAPVG